MTRNSFRVFVTAMHNAITCGDAFELIRGVRDASIDLVITSPPYFRQREYTDAVEELGREADVHSYVERLLDLFGQCLRVVKPTGSVVVNLGDKYLDSCLQLVPYRFALRAAEKATLVNQVTWVKANPTPRQFNRRLVSATEPFFHFVKGKNYKYNIDALAGPREARACTASRVGEGYYDQIEHSSLTDEEKANARRDLAAVIEEIRRGELFSMRMKIRGTHTLAFGGQEGGRNTQIIKNGYSIIRVPGKKMQRDVFECAVETIRGAKHPAVFPQAVVENFIKLTTDVGDTVLDPFMGSGTTALACLTTGRAYLGFELSQEYVRHAKERIAGHERKSDGN